MIDLNQIVTSHGVEGFLAAVVSWLGYTVKRRDKKIDDIELALSEMPFIYAMKDDVREIKADVKDIKNHLLNQKLGD